MKGKFFIISTGAIVGLFAVVLVAMGNPANMGYCIACFLRDITGALGLHRAEVVQYIRPEIVGLILGAFITAIATKEFKVVGGSGTLTRFVLAFFAIIGMLMFLGCPLRMLLRIAGGDWNAIVGLVGLIVGVFIGTMFLKHGYSLGKATVQTNKFGGYVMPLIGVVLLIFLFAKPSFISFSQEGPGSMHAPVLISLGVGLLVGVMAQRSRLCLVGGIRDFIFFRDTHLLSGFLSIFIVALIGNLIVGNFNPGFTGQPIAHNDGLWNFLGMTLAGLASVLLGGCPLRQLITAAEGNADSAVTVLGLMAGAAFAHNFGLAASGNGVTGGGQIATIIGLAVVLVIGACGIMKAKNLGGAANVNSDRRSRSVVS